jgi:dTDP-4-amino-4,6-dideoxygalactose transaminase
MSEKLAIHGGTPVRSEPWPPPNLGIAEFGVEEEEAVLRVLREQRVFRYTSGDDVSETARMERAFADDVGRTYAHAVNSGTSAIICSLVGCGVGWGDEVIVPAYTYIATAAAVVGVGAVPVIAEVDNSLTIDPEDIKRKITPYTKAIIPVHMRGVPCRMDEIMAIARENGLKVIEDTAQADGGSYKGKPLASIGDAGIFSFQQSKTITAGEGGLFLTDDEAIFERGRMAHDSAFGFWKPDESEQRPIPGVGMRISEVSGAIALVQHGRLAGIVEKLHARKYAVIEQIKDLDGIELQEIPDPEGDASVALIFFAKTEDKANEISKALNAEGIGSGTMHSKDIPDRHIYRNWVYVLEKRGWSDKITPWSPEVYQGDVEYSEDMCPQSLDYLGRAIHIGLSQKMTEKDATDLATAIRKVVTALA